VKTKKNKNQKSETAEIPLNAEAKVSDLVKQAAGIFFDEEVTTPAASIKTQEVNEEIETAGEIADENVVDELAHFSSEEIDDSDVLDSSLLADLPIIEEDGLTEETHEQISTLDLEGTELEAFESEEVEQIESLPAEKIQSIVESLLFSTDKPISALSMKSAFQGTNVKIAEIRKAIEVLQLDYTSGQRGVQLDEVAGGFQLRTKVDNLSYLQHTVKARPFRLSGPALEVLSILAYKQPCTKSAVDEIRGVESGHLMRGLLDRGLIAFGEKSELPGRPMYYATTKKFLEIFSLRNLEELPTLEEMDQLIPVGIGEEEIQKPKLSDLTGELSQASSGTVYSENEEELMDIASDLQAINTSTQFFEDEKRRQKDKKDSDRAQDILERLTVGEAVDEKDKKWLAKYETEKNAAIITVKSESSSDTQIEANDSSSDTSTINTTTEATIEPETSTDL
jgi:segregation and condensation protein B